MPRRCASSASDTSTTAAATRASAATGLSSPCTQPRLFLFLCPFSALFPSQCSPRCDACAVDLRVTATRARAAAARKRLFVCSAPSLRCPIPMVCSSLFCFSLSQHPNVSSSVFGIAAQSSVQPKIGLTTVACSKWWRAQCQSDRALRIHLLERSVSTQ